MESQNLKLELSNALIKRYKIRSVGRLSRTLETTIPREVFERAARRLGFDVELALERLVAVWYYDSFEGLYLTFEEKQPT